MLGAYSLQLFLQANSDALGVEGIGFRKHEAKNFRCEAIDRVGGAEFARHGFRGVTEGGRAVGLGGSGTELGANQQQSEIFLHGHGAAIFHGKAIPEMVDVRHGMQQVGAGLQAQLDVALEFFENLLLELADSALALQQIADEEKGKGAEAEKGYTECPLIGGVGVDEDERI